MRARDSVANVWVAATVDCYSARTWTIPARSQTFGAPTSQAVEDLSIFSEPFIGAYYQSVLKEPVSTSSLTGASLFGAFVESNGLSTAALFSDSKPFKHVFGAFSA